MDDILGAVVERTTRDRLARRVTAINNTTRDRIRDMTVQAVDEGLSPSQFGKMLRGVVNPLESDKVGQALARKLGSFGSELRAETIARTEMRVAQNAAQLDAFKGLGGRQVELIDGDDDPVCAARNGRIVSLEEAEGIMLDEHPNGTLTFAPAPLDVDPSFPPEPSPVEVIRAPKPESVEDWASRQRYGEGDLESGAIFDTNGKLLVEVEGLTSEQAVARGQLAGGAADFGPHMSQVRGNVWVHTHPGTGNVAFSPEDMTLAMVNEPAQMVVKTADRTFTLRAGEKGWKGAGPDANKGMGFRKQGIMDEWNAGLDDAFAEPGITSKPEYERLVSEAAARRVARTYGLRFESRTRHG